MLQVALVIPDVSTVLVTILDRFGLLPHFTGNALRAAYEGPQPPNMIEKVLYIIITILSESGNPPAVRREVTHGLAMGPCTYTDLTKRVAERLVEDASFERELKKITTFRPPLFATSRPF